MPQTPLGAHPCTRGQRCCTSCRRASRASRATKPDIWRRKSKAMATEAVRAKVRTAGMEEREPAGTPVSAPRWHRWGAPRPCGHARSLGCVVPGAPLSPLTQEEADDLGDAAQQHAGCHLRQHPPDVLLPRLARLPLRLLLAGMGGWGARPAYGHQAAWGCCHVDSGTPTCPPGTFPCPQVPLGSPS